jgi:hypothetical protein
MLSAVLSPTSFVIQTNGVALFFQLVRRDMDNRCRHRRELLGRMFRHRDVVYSVNPTIPIGLGMRIIAAPFRRECG